MTEALMDCANQHCGNRILSVLEGGYHLDALAHSVSTHIGTLAGISADP
jgi:acetoin utilization deacetylase AcuC-like enzyme